MFICTRLFETMQKKIDNLNNTLQENLVAIRVVKIFVRADYERKKFKKSNDELMDAALAVGLRIIAILPIMMLAMNGATVAVLYFGGRMVMNATFDLGQLQAFINYIVQILMSVMMVAMSLLQLSRAQACAHRINEVLNTEPSVEDKPEAEKQVLPAPKGEVEFRDVSFKYVATGTGDDVLSHISFDVKPGQFVAIVGGTGTGKSSLVNLIPRFYDVTGGAVLLDGVDVRDYPLEELRSRIGMVLQTNVLFTGTIRENLKWGKEDATEEEIIQAAKDAQAYDFIMALPQGYDTMVGEGGSNLSGGEKQRISIARCLLKDAPIIILDEATASVDPENEHEIQEALSALVRGKTIITIAHRLATIQNADRILVVEDGRIAQQGTHQELMSQEGIYRNFIEIRQRAEGWRI